ncbi:AraC family transcriptional regulator [Acinetobacter oleivorans]|uniref:helix-turn-helix transcriptional regulator n=1 Tax=Acinetobacter oleivorans TaxID=1148157 RepID=UPI000D30AF61|nr:AraC family transcriptional regulator [Acinetobacter oleivorans]PTV44513.1 AraC family transcriptional regulator [Acinetobacter oleivorans]
MRNKSDMDTLSDIFFDIYKKAQISGQIYQVEDFKSKNILFFNGEYSYIHIFQGSNFNVQCDELKMNEELNDGEVLVIPSRVKHSIEIIDNKKSDFSVITCIFQLQGAYGSMIAEGLPKYILVPINPIGKVAEWVPMTVAAIKLELGNPTLGSQVMISSIIDLLLVWSIRFWLSKATEMHKSWILALSNPSLSRAIFLMHTKPAQNWTVEVLAKETHQSKSKFSKNFNELVGTSPINYLKNWRMKLAVKYLTESNNTVSQVAELVGYSSQAAFTRAFVQTFGCSPKKFLEHSINK